MIHGKKIENLNEIIGAKCVYKFNDSDTWDDWNTVECKVVAVDCEISDTLPYDFRLFFQIIPIEKDCLEVINAQNLEFIGVEPQNLIFPL